MRNGCQKVELAGAGTHKRRKRDSNKRLLKMEIESYLSVWDASRQPAPPRRFRRFTLVVDKRKDQRRRFSFHPSSHLFKALQLP